MKNSISWSIIPVCLVTLLVGCYSPNGQPDNTANGALIGGSSGAVIGAIADRRDPGAGALLGGAAGLLVGGLIGHSVDQQNEARAASEPPPSYGPPPLPLPPSIADIKALAKSGLNDDVIIGQISNTHAVYHLDANALIDLHNSGVSEKVIAYMINTADTIATLPPPPPPVETVTLAPGPDYVWNDGEWVWSGGAWVWIGGRWALPPYPHAVWIGGRWDHGGDGWHRVGGHWR